ncbi:damaged DNA methylation oxygenase domain protein, partial [Bordetella holmesii H620]
MRPCVMARFPLGSPRCASRSNPWPGAGWPT